MGLWPVGSLVVALSMGSTWDVDAPSVCPQADAFEARVRRLAPHLDAAELRASVRIRSISRERVRALVVVHSEPIHVERTVEAATCAVALDAAAVVVAITHEAALGLRDGAAPLASTRRDVEAAVDSPPSEEAPIVPDAPAAEIGSTTTPIVAPSPLGPAIAARPPTSSPPSRPPTRRRLRLRGLVRAEIGLSLRSLPRYGALFGLATGLAIGRWRVELIGSHTFAQPARLPAPQDDAGADVRLWSVGAQASFVPSWRILEFPIHAGAELGAMIADPTGVNRPESQRSLWGAILVGAGIAVVPFPQLSLRVDPTLVLGVSRPTFAIGRGGQPPLELFQPPVVGVRVLGALEVRIP